MLPQTIRRQSIHIQVNSERAYKPKREHIDKYYKECQQCPYEVCIVSSQSGALCPYLKAVAEAERR